MTTDGQAARPAYKRVLLKISGEALMGGQGYGISPEVIQHVAAEIADTARLGVELAPRERGFGVVGEGRRRDQRKHQQPDDAHGLSYHRPVTAAMTS